MCALNSPRALRHVSERVEQTNIVRLLRTLGAAVWVTGTTRPRGDYHGTCMSPGLPDCVCFLPPRGLHGARLVFIEVKAHGGKLRPDQVAFRAQCLAAGVDHLVGGLDNVIAWLIAERYLHPDAVAAHHLVSQTPQKQA